jgi:hypothetical protein
MSIKNLRSRRLKRQPPCIFGESSLTNKLSRVDNKHQWISPLELAVMNLSSLLALCNLTSNMGIGLSDV